METIPTCPYEVRKSVIDLSFPPVTMKGWCLVLVTVNNSFTCALDSIYYCFVKQLVLSMANPSLYFSLYWLLKFPKNKQKQTLSTSIPSSHHFFFPLLHNQILKSCLYGYSQFLSVLTFQHPALLSYRIRSC